VCGFRIPIEATAGKISCEPFSERQESLWQNGKIFKEWSGSGLSGSPMHSQHLTTQWSGRATVGIGGRRGVVQCGPPLTAGVRPQWRWSDYEVHDRKERKDAKKECNESVAVLHV